MAYTDRVVVLVDMDCFYCQVEEKFNPALKGKPIAVVQYNAWQGGGIIAVNYPAREKGVTRHMRGNEAKQKCPDIVLARVPQVRGKADLSKYREAGKSVADVLKTFTPLLERASVDEAYLDITDVVNKKIEMDFEQLRVENMKNSYVVGWDIEDYLYNIQNNKEYSESNCKLAMGGLIAEEIRAEVYRKTGYKCSAGIAHNKILAKLVCGLHKPNKQTILPQESVSELYKDLPVKKIKSLGGKFGNALSEDLNITKMGELIKFSQKDLADKFDDKTAKWLYNIARGIDLEPVTLRLVSKSIGCCKKFPGKSALVTPVDVEHWMNELSSEIFERLEKDLEENNRRAKQMVISFAQEINRKDVSSSRTISLHSYDQSKIMQSGLNIIKKNCMSNGTYKIKFLGLSVGNFEDNTKVNILSFFKNANERNPVVIDTKNTEIVFKTAETSIGKDSPSVDKNMQNDDGNESVYSATTDESNEDATSLIYYEDMFPESQASQPILEKSADGYLNIDSNCDRETANRTSSSFFTQYFQNSMIDANNKRNYTSKTLEENDVTSSDKLTNSPVLQTTHDTITIAEPSIDEAITENTSYTKHICPECSKGIYPSDLQSHMDYHLALNIVKSEAHQYKSEMSQLEVKDKINKKTASHGIKRKNGNKTKDINPILAFFKREELNNENSEMCVECNKRINLEELASHSDYHVAKKLHMEINSCSKSVLGESDFNRSSSQIDNSKNTPNSLRERGSNTTARSVKQVHSFFKP